MEKNIKKTSKETTNHDLLYLEILINKLKIEYLKLQTGGRMDNFRKNTLELLEKIREEIENASSPAKS